MDSQWSLAWLDGRSFIARLRSPADSPGAGFDQVQRFHGTRAPVSGAGCSLAGTAPRMRLCDPLGDPSMFKIEALPAFTDNYIWLLQDDALPALRGGRSR